MSFPRYPRYRDSGVEWLGEVPERWNTHALRSIARSGEGTFTDGDWIESPFITDEGVRLIQTGNVGVGVYKEQGYRFISRETFEEFGCTEVEPGDVLICRLAEPVGRACLAPDLGTPMITSVDVCILKPRADIDARYVVYMLSSVPYLSFMEAQCRGGTRDRVSRSFLGSVRIPLPEPADQVAIASFLDTETYKIDALIAEQERLIELLKEKRQAVISHAVTCGLNPDVPMKPSGVEWLGDVPAHWTVTRLKYAVSTFFAGGTPEVSNPLYWGDADTEGDVPWVTIGDMTRSTIVGATERRISRAGLESKRLEILPAGTLLYSMYASVGKVAVLSHPAAVNQAILGIKPNEGEVRSAYLREWLTQLERYLDLFSSSNTQDNINAAKVRALPVFIPPPSEQDAIADFLSSQQIQFETLTAEATRAIALLRERRTALISAAVTGKIDVRTLADAA